MNRNPAPVRQLNVRRPRRPKKAARPTGLILATAAVLAGAGWLAWNSRQSPPAATQDTTSVVAPDVAITPPVPAAPPAVVAATPATPAPVEMPATAPVSTPSPETTAPAPVKATVAFDKPLALDPMRARADEAIAHDTAMLEAAFRTGQWADYTRLLRTSLRTQLLTHYRPADPDTAETLLTNPAAAMALTRFAFLNALGTEGQSLLAVPAHSVLARWLLGAAPAMESLAASLTPEDDLPGVFAVLQEIITEDNDARTTWVHLAVATALVFDQPYYGKWNGRPLRIDPFQRYAWYKNNATAGKLTGKIKDMSAAELGWVVCAPVPESELDWALRKTNFRQKSWGTAYGKIKYLMERAVNGLNPYKEYTFAEILDKGGICGDQAYFAANTARAHGIPASVVSGDGKRGPHAWITWLADTDEWDFSGRFDGYPAGKTTHPQTGHGFSEEEFVRMSDRKASSSAMVRKARKLLQLAALFSDEADAGAAGALIDYAVTTASRFPTAWHARITHWMQHRATADIALWRTMLAAAEKEFAESASMLELVREAEEKCVFSRQDASMTMRDLKKDARKATTPGRPDNDDVEANSDEIALAFRRSAELLLKNGDQAGIRTIYHKAFASHGSNPAMFKKLARDYFALAKRDPDAATKACSEMESAARRLVGTRGGDWFDITSQASAWKVVADCCRKAGLTKKADQITKDTERRVAAAKKRAV